jgi:hypothetical protein
MLYLVRQAAGRATSARGTSLIIISIASAAGALITN